jgi:hypothetical protein
MSSLNRRITNPCNWGSPFCSLNTRERGHAIQGHHGGSCSTDVHTKSAQRRVLASASPTARGFDNSFLWSMM